MKFLFLFVLLCAASLSAFGQGITVINAASQHGIIAPGSLAEIQGESFTEESTYAEFPGDLPTELDGVSVSIDGVLCRLWFVTPQHLQVISPDFPIRTSYRFGWKVVEVKCKDGRLLHGWTVVLPVAPGIVFQQGMPQGLWNVPHTEHVGVRFGVGYQKGDDEMTASEPCADCRPLSLFVGGDVVYKMLKEHRLIQR